MIYLLYMLLYVLESNVFVLRTMQSGLAEGAES